MQCRAIPSLTTPFFTCYAKECHVECQECQAPLRPRASCVTSSPITLPNYVATNLNPYSETLKTVPCNCFLGPFFLSRLTQLYQHLAGRCAAGFHTAGFPGLGSMQDMVVQNRVKSCKIWSWFEDYATSGRVLRTMQHLVVFSRLNSYSGGPCFRPKPIS